MGIPFDFKTIVYGDNQSVLSNTTISKSTLKKKTQSIAFHNFREGTTRDEWRTAYINTHDIVDDMITEPLPSGEKRWKFVRKFLHHL